MDNNAGVNALKSLIDTLVNEFKSNQFVSSVRIGTMNEVDLDKQNLFPLAHIVINDVTHNEHSFTFNFTILNLDSLIISKDEITDQTYGNDNLYNIWTNQLYVINRLVARMKSSTIYQDGFELDGTPRSEFIDRQFEQMLAGVQTDISITVPNNINKCS